MNRKKKDIKSEQGRERKLIEKQQADIDFYIFEREKRERAMEKHVEKEQDK